MATRLLLKLNQGRRRLLLNQLTEPHWMGAVLSEKTVQFFAASAVVVKLTQLKEVFDHLFA